MTTLHACCEVKLHIVPQVIETKLIVGSVSDVGGVGGLALEVVHVVLNTSDFETEEAMDLAHPLGVARSEVVVNSNYVNTTTTCKRIQVCRQSRNERLALACAHLGNFALVQDDAADQLHVEVTHARSAHACFSDDGESLRQNLIEHGALTSLSFVFVGDISDFTLHALFEVGCTCAQLVVRKRLN